MDICGRRMLVVLGAARRTAACLSIFNVVYRSRIDILWRIPPCRRPLVFDVSAQRPAPNATLGGESKVPGPGPMISGRHDQEFLT